MGRWRVAVFGAARGLLVGFPIIKTGSMLDHFIGNHFGFVDKIQSSWRFDPLLFLGELLIGLTNLESSSRALTSGGHTSAAGLSTVAPNSLFPTALANNRVQ